MIEPLDDDFWANHAYIRIRGRSRIHAEPTQVVSESRIYMGSIHSQDDIFEGRPVILKPARPTRAALVDLAIRRMPGATHRAIRDVVDNIQRRTASDDDFARSQNEIVAANAELYARSSILSFFRTPLDQRSWAQYGEQGRGHAFVFDFRDGWPMVCAPNLAPLQAVPHEVIYVPEGNIPPIRTEIGPIDSKDGWEAIERALLMKSDKWSDQQEERLIRLGIPQGFIDFPHDSLCGVILGYAAPVDDERLLGDLCTNRATPIPMYRVVVDHARRSLTLQQLA